MTVDFEDRLLQIVEHLPEVVWMLDGRVEEVLYTNPTYERLLGRLSSNSQWPLCPADLVHPDDEQAALDWLESIRRDLDDGMLDSEYPFEVRLTSADGETHWLETVAVPISQGDTVIGFVGISSDITERIAREQELVEEIGRLDQFVGMVTHEIRSPLTVAQAELNLYGETKNAEHLEGIAVALDRLNVLTTDLLELAHRGVDSVECASIHLNILAQKAWSSVDTGEATLQTEPGVIEADESKLRTLLENLFRNAVSHGGPDVTVRVGSLETGFYVEDTGNGVSAETHEQLLRHGFSTSSEGTGIGLTIVQRIAELHEWSVQLCDSHEGGVRFEFHDTEEVES